MVQGLVHLQATEDLYAIVDERRLVLLYLADGGGSSGSSSLAAVGQQSIPQRPQLALAAAAADERVRKLLYLIENVLAIIFDECWRCLPHPMDPGATSMASKETGLSVFIDRPASSGQPARNRQLLGSDRDLDQLRRLLQPVLEHLTALGDQDIGRDSASVQILNRRLKEYVVML